MGTISAGRWKTIMGTSCECNKKLKENHRHKTHKMTDVVRSFIPHDTMLFTYRELAGFYDVDGSFFSPRKRAATPCYYETLGMIQKSFGGPVTKRNISDRTKSERNRYMSTIHAMEERVLKPSIENYLVLKADPICFDRINKEYVRGVFCAVGCLKTFGLTLQHEFIEHIKAFVDKDIGVALGKINGKEWTVADHRGMKTFLDWMTLGLPRLFHEEKAKKIDAFYTYLETKDPVGMKRENRVVSDDVLGAYVENSREYVANLRDITL